MTVTKQFCEAVKPIFSNKNFRSDNHILITDKNKIVDNEQKLVQVFSTFSINTVKNLTNKALTSLWSSSNQQRDIDNVQKIISE